MKLTALRYATRAEAEAHARLYRQHRPWVYRSSYGDWFLSFYVLVCAVLLCSCTPCEVYQGMKEANDASGLGGRKPTKAEIQKWKQNNK